MENGHFGVRRLAAAFPLNRPQAWRAAADICSESASSSKSGGLRGRPNLLRLLPGDRQLSEGDAQLKALSFSGQRKVRVAFDERRRCRCLSGSGAGRGSVVASEELADARDAREVADAVSNLG